MSMDIEQIREGRWRRVATDRKILKALTKVVQQMIPALAQAERELEEVATAIETRCATDKEKRGSMSSLQDRLRTIVQQAGSQKAVADLTGVNQGTISRILRGSRVGSMRTYEKLVQAYPDLEEVFVSPNIPICTN